MAHAYGTIRLMDCVLRAKYCNGCCDLDKFVLKGGKSKCVAGHHRKIREFFTKVWHNAIGNRTNTLLWDDKWELLYLFVT